MASTEALRLADAIDPLTRRNLDNLTCAAAELRRLHAENETLLEALGKMVAVYSGQVQNDGGYTVLDSARPLITDQAAIKAVEENT